MAPASRFQVRRLPTARPGVAGPSSGPKSLEDSYPVFIGDSFRLAAGQTKECRITAEVAVKVRSIYLTGGVDADGGPIFLNSATRESGLKFMDGGESGLLVQGFVMGGAGLAQANNGFKRWFSIGTGRAIVFTVTNPSSSAGAIFSVTMECYREGVG